MDPHTLAALRELVRAIDRRLPHVERESEARIARDARLLRHQAVTQIEGRQRAARGSDGYEPELVDAIMTDDGGPPPLQRGHR
jgi:hypothetical protein